MAGFGSESVADALFWQNARVGPALAFYLNGHSTTKRYTGNESALVAQAVPRLALRTARSGFPSKLTTPSAERA